jgi:predicted nucleic-acid-binding protein
MIAVDTNVLVRLFVVDEPQSAIAASFFGARSAGDPAYVPLVAMAEFGWVLRKKYKYPVDRIVAAVQAMLDSDDFLVERREVVEWALARYDSPKVELSDMIIARAGELAGCPSTMTFDREAAKRVPGMELLK